MLVGRLRPACAPIISFRILSAAVEYDHQRGPLGQHLRAVEFRCQSTRIWPKVLEKRQPAVGSAGLGQLRAQSREAGDGIVKVWYT